MSFLTKCNFLRGVPRGETSHFGKPAVPSAATEKRSFRHGLLFTGGMGEERGTRSNHQRVVRARIEQLLPIKRARNHTLGGMVNYY
ncbi:hypothetical protein A6770_32180 [Nostoc minutum NIES-26]|uniref:Uncharacterized protein n=1 Tax=Nostoc minutum NIES-26 TaxID=1844469 RepID=A0A367Q613_9NOSO|nr:hypothetical protein A6770_32180 [Nostoc minutum NIES-26]